MSRPSRCRPNYATELLETMKNFFNSPGVVYVVANNADELGHSIRALYGAEFDAARYLKRFFDFQYRLKDPDTRLFCEGISVAFGFDEAGRFLTPLRRIHPSYSRGGDACQDLVGWHLQLAMELFGLSLRDIRQIALRIQAISTITNDTLDIFLLVFMVSADHKKSNSHRRMLLSGQREWHVTVPSVVNIGLRNNSGNRDGIENTTIARIFGFYGSAELNLSQNQGYAANSSMTMLNREVLEVVERRQTASDPIEKMYCSLVEQLNNLTM